MKDMIKKLVEARFRGPTDDPSFADPGGSMEYDELSDRVTDMLDDVTKGEVANLQGKQLSYNDFGDGDGQYLLDGDVFANSYDEAERKILDMLDPRYNEQNNLGEQIMKIVSERIDEERILTIVKNKIMENLTAGRTGLAQKKLKGAAGEAEKRLATPGVNRAIGLATQRLQRATTQQKVDFIVSMIQRLGIKPEELEGMMSKLKTTVGRAADASADAAAE